MKEYDRVRLIRDRQAYTKRGVSKGREGYIMDPRCIEGKWLVAFSGEFFQRSDGVWYTTDIECGVKEEDLEVVKSADFVPSTQKSDFEIYWDAHTPAERQYYSDICSNLRAALSNCTDEAKLAALNDPKVTGELPDYMKNKLKKDLGL